MRYLIAIVTVLGIARAAAAQTPAITPRFEVASVKPNTTNDPPTSRFPLGPGDAYLAGTLFAATNQPLINYIRFAFGRSQGELLRLPSWIYDERFDIQGRTAGDPKKDDMRMMVRALLVERFKLAWHLEPQETAVLELVQAKPGELGPQLIRQDGVQPCEQGVATGGDATFTAIPCGSAGLVSASTPGRSRIAGRAEPITRLAGVLSNNRFAGVDRSVIDRTGLTGTFDFVVEWAVPIDPVDTGPPPPSGDAGPPIDVALRQQLGLLLRPTKASVDVLVIDHVERPTDN